MEKWENKLINMCKLINTFFEIVWEVKKISVEMKKKGDKI